MRKIFIPLLLLVPYLTNGQQVTKDFTKLLQEEQFNSSSENWEQAYNSDNLFLIQNGKYELFRQNRSSGYFIFPKKERQYDACEISCKVTFDKHKNKKQSTGIIIMATKNFSGGLFVEINSRNEYRVQRISSGGPKAISTGKNEGWVKSKSAITKSTNIIKIKAHNKLFDLYINDKFLLTFSDIELFRGNIGLFVGPNSKCSFDYLKVMGDDEIDLANTEIKTNEQEEKSLTQIILKLRRTLNEKDKKIEDLEKKLGSSKRNTYVDTAARRENRELKKSNKILAGEKEYFKNKVDNLNKENAVLRKFKKELQENEDGDIVINLTNIVTRQKGQITKLSEESSQCQKEYKSLNEQKSNMDIELKRVSETNIILREILKDKDSLIKTQTLHIERLKKRRVVKDSAEFVPTEKKKDDNNKKDDNKEEEEEGDKNDLLKQILERERKEREKENDNNSEDDSSN